MVASTASMRVAPAVALPVLLQHRCSYLTLADTRAHNFGKTARLGQSQMKTATRTQVGHTITSELDLEKFTWKGGGDSLGTAWEEPGLYLEAPKNSGMEWFFLDVGPKTSKQPVMVLIHGFPAYSFMWRNVLPNLADAGRRAVVMDLPGCGNSSMIQVGAGYNYTFEEYVSSLDAFIDRMELSDKPVQLVTQGFVGGTVGALWAARNPEKVAKLTLMNQPLDETTAGALPKCFKPLTNPFLSAIFCQNPLNIVGRPIEESGPYALDVNDQAAYLQPVLADGNAGFISVALAKEVAKSGPKALKESLNKLSQGVVPVEIIWGNSDSWLGEDPPSAAVTMLNAKVTKLAGAGHFAAEDWAEKTADALLGRPVRDI